MAITLCIDRGNTRLKAAVVDAASNRIIENHAIPEEESLAALAMLIARHEPKGAILCSVTNDNEAYVQLLQEQVPHVVVLDTRTSLPIMNAYHSNETLGADRLALAVGAHGLFPDQNNLVISLGTCITYNFIHRNRTFRGGAISPGLHMRLKAMHHFTDKLPEAPAEGDLLLLGYDTDTNLRSGAVFGMAAEIDGMIAAFHAQFPDFNAVLTGGDAPYFERKLKSKIFADPDLLLKGLNLILKHNVPILR